MCWWFGHRNVNKMIIKNLLGLSFEEGYRVEHKSPWLYIFAPKRAEIFLVKIPAPQEPVQVQAGYGGIDMTSQPGSVRGTQQQSGREV